MFLQEEKVSTPTHRLLHVLGLVVAALLLFWVGKGFPPLPWQLLFRVLPQLAPRIHAGGFAVVAAVLGVLILACAFLVLWLALIVYSIWLVRSFLNDSQTHKKFFLKQPRAVRVPLQETEIPQRAVQQPSVHAKQLIAGRHSSYPQQQNTLRKKTRLSRLVKSANVPATIQAQLIPPGSVPRKSTAQASQRILPRKEEGKENGTDEQETMPMCAPENTLVLIPESHDASLYLSVSAVSDPGITRRSKPNEDAVFAQHSIFETTQGPQPVGLFLVADGMGGHANGREASHLALEVFSETLRPALLYTVQDEDILTDLMKDGVERANTSIYQQNQGRDLDSMMGTTITAALLVGSKAYIANVGDSRTYLFRQEKGLSQVTRDHSRVAKMVEQGVLTPENARTHQYRSQIYRCLGHEEAIEIDIFQETLQRGDTLLLCSDGLWEMVRDDKIEKIMQQNLSQPSHVSRGLLHAALKAGGADNISMVVVCMHGMTVV